MATFRGEGVVAVRGSVSGLTYVFESGVPLEIDARDAGALRESGRFVTGK